jgi:MFS superfamily sulfate permease-like transporter
MLVLLFLTPVFENMPYCIMAAVIIGGVSTLIEVRYMIELLRTDLRDFFIFLVTFCVVLFYSIDVGLGVGIGLSLFIYILETGFPSKQRLGRLVFGGGGGAAIAAAGSVVGSPSKARAAKAADALVVKAGGGDTSDDPNSGSDGTLDQHQHHHLAAPTAAVASGTVAAPVDAFLDVAEYPAGQLRPLPAGVVALRLQAPVAFNNTQALEDLVEDVVVDAEDAHRADPDKHSLVQYILLDLSTSGHIDSSGCHSIGTEIGQRFADKGVQLVLVGANKRVLRALERTGAMSKGNLRAWVFTNLADAVAATQHVRLVLTDRAKQEDKSEAKAAEAAARKQAAKERKEARRRGGSAAAVAAGVV